MRSRRLIPRLHVFAAVLATAMMWSSIPAYATATSGIQFKGNPVLANGQTVDGCAEAIIADVADFKAFNNSYAPVGAYCSTSQSVPPGYLAVFVFGYRNGQYCGQTGIAYNSTYASSFGVGGFICSNPAGSQSFFSSASVGYYAGPSYPYNNGYAYYPPTVSPSQAY